MEAVARGRLAAEAAMKHNWYRAVHHDNCTCYPDVRVVVV